MDSIDRDELKKLIDGQAQEQARLMRRAEKAEERAKENEADCWCVGISICILLMWLFLVTQVLQ